MARLSAGSNTKNGVDGSTSGNTDSMSSRVQEISRADDTSSGSEGRTLRKLQKNSPAGMRPSEPTPLAGIISNSMNTATSRRRQSSMRDQRAPQAQQILQSSPSKRLAYNKNPDPRTVPPTLAPNAPLAQARHSSILDPSKRNFGSVSASSKEDETQLTSNIDFLPSVNFDDFHASIATDGSFDGSFPPLDGGTDYTPTASSGVGSTTSRPGMKGPSRTVDSSELGSRNGFSGSLLHQFNGNAQQAAQPTEEAEGIARSIDSGSTRFRRKSYFQMSTTGASVARHPRKSVGPGILTSGLETISVQQRRPSLARVVLGEDDSSTKSTSAGNQDLFARQPGSFESSRYHKAKSFQAASRRTLDQPTTPDGTKDAADYFLASTARSPARSSTYQRTITPSSSKRLSIMPNSAHATGLAARTISPTDARRIKRMSMMPNPPPLPYPPTTPQEPAISVGLPSAPSPSMIPRKSVTPSSSRTTPDPNRKSYSSGISNSSNTSYNSFLASNSSLRISQSFSTSRLPTPKTRPDNVPVGDEEVVPPVPAIPKAYESPKGDVDIPFFSSRKSSLGFDISSLNSMSTQNGLHAPQVAQERRHIKGTTGEADTPRERKPSGGAPNRRTLQPLRLPPLNLLPLSTPTATKIAAMHHGSATTNTETVTPPPKKGIKTTPTTPMTASRATFQREYFEDETAPLPAQIRSSSSHHTMRSEVLTYRAGSSSSTAPPTPVDPYAFNASRPAISPFVSSSLPKTSGDFGHLRREMSNPVDIGHETRPSKLTGPRLQKPRKASKDDASSMDTASSFDTSTQSIGSSLRRKLSMSRKRSASKVQTAAEREEELPPKPPRHDDMMPPPRLPASATWSGPLLPSPSPTQKYNQSRASRNVSNSSIVIQNDRSRSNTWDSGQTPKKETKTPQTTPAVGPKRTARSVLEGTPSQNALSLKDFLHEAKTMELQLDRDDLSAEEEMKRLASKRKETENAAKEVDALRRRATAKERVSPNKALDKAHRILNRFEIGEIVDYKEIYFCGTQNAQKHVGDMSTEATNFGYDDERGDYNIVSGDHLSYRYEIVDILGKGSFGQVVRCVDHKTGGLVAIKIIRNKKRFHQQALVEVEILRKLREWDPQNKHSMVSFTQSFYFRGHLCISTELLGMNLYEFIKCHDFRGFSLKLIRRFAKQLLSSLVLLKKHKVIHCDLKPENVLLAHPARSEIKVIDFGSSCLENEKVYTYIQSRFYRSPEVILGMTYGMPIDMWSLGCILAELLTGYPIFPGENEQEQLACIMEVFGPPEKHLIEKSSRKKIFFDSLGKPRITVSSKGKRRRPSSKTLQQALKCEDEAFLDFITRCLRWDPDRRLKPNDAINHDFITGKSTKAAARPRTAPAPSSTSASPLKRLNSISQTPSNIRPLPDPPVTSFKNGTAVRNATASTASPSKQAATLAAPKRHSTMTNQQTNGAGSGVKRTLNGAAVQGSALPRVMSTQRVGSGGMASGGTGKGVDLAAAAAAASLAQKSR